MGHGPQCGHENAAQSNFCNNCGARLNAGAGGTGDTTRIIPAIVDDAIMDELSADDQRAIDTLPAGSALLITRRGTHGGRFLVDVDKTEAGRHPDAGIFLDDATVSRHHAEFTRREGGLFVRDLGSLNGTYLNRKPVEGETQLKTGDELQIGKFKMVCFVSARG